MKINKYKFYLLVRTFSRIYLIIGVYLFGLILFKKNEIIDPILKGLMLFMLVFFFGIGELSFYKHPKGKQQLAIYKKQNINSTLELFKFTQAYLFWGILIIVALYIFYLWYG